MSFTLSPKWIFFGLIVVAVALEVAADVLFRKWSIENKALLLGAGLILYFIGTLFWAFSLKHETLSKSIVVFTLLNLIAGVAVGLLYFKEELSLFQKAGIGIGFLSVALIEWEG
jgi:drug/metabolite transporter (DMT)-like permease